MCGLNCVGRKAVQGISPLPAEPAVAVRAFFLSPVIKTYLWQRRKKYPGQKENGLPV